MLSTNPPSTRVKTGASHSGSTSNQYFICLNFEDAEPIAWPLYDDPLPDAPEYFTQVFQAMERHLTVSNLTVYLTWRLDHLPTTGDNVIAVVLGDEWSRIPRFAPDVLATFKTYGSRPPWDVDLQRADRFNFLRLLKQARIYTHYMPGWLHHLRRTGTTRLLGRFSGTETSPAPIYDCPLGYGNQLDLPIRPIHERKTDVFFAGSIEHREEQPTLRSWVSSPKTVARRAMLRNIEALLERNPDLSVDLAISSAFVLNALHYGTEIEGRVLDETEYSESMMDAKVCLIPRGTSPETFRFFEAIRYGCVLITESLPDRWFYNGSPAIQVRHWDEMPDIVSGLLADPERLAKKQQDALEWWNQVCSPRAVGRYFAECINAQSSL